MYLLMGTYIFRNENSERASFRKHTNLSNLGNDSIYDLALERSVDDGTIYYTVLHKSSIWLYYTSTNMLYIRNSDDKAIPVHQLREQHDLLPGASSFDVRKQLGFHCFC